MAMSSPAMAAIAAPIYCRQHCASLAATARPAGMKLRRMASWKVRVAELEAPEATTSTSEESAPSSEAPAAAVDRLTMMLRAEGSIPELSIPAVKSILEEMEDVKDVDITTYEGMTSISLTKSTVIQATNVASEIVEAMERGGFRMHTLNLAIDDED